MEWSGPIYRIFGVQPEEFGNDVDAFFELVHPDDRARVREEVRRALEEDVPYSVHHRIVRPDGEERILHEQAEVIRDRGGRPVQMRGTVEDITQWRETREALKLRDEAIKICLTPIFVVDAQLNFTFVNQAFVDLIGAGDESELLGQPSLRYADDASAVRAIVRTVRVMGSWQGEAVALRVDGGRVPVQVAAVRVPSAATPDEVVVSILDLTDLRETERERMVLQGKIRSVAREWSQTFDAIEVPIFLLRWNGTVRRLNVAAADLVTGGFAGALDRRLEGIGTGEPWRTAAELVREVRVHGESLFREVRDRETQATWHLTVSPALPEEPRKSRWLVVIFRDVTELYRLQETLRRTEKMSAMGALVARVSHEVRNPLFGISATVDALTAEFGSDDHLAEYLEVLRGEVIRMSRVMEDLLDYGRPVALDVAPSTVTEVVGGALAACRPVAAAAGVTLLQEHTPDLPRVEVDPGKIRQVLQNLVENAVQHSKSGAEVSVRSGLSPRRDVLYVRVEDRGPGLGSEDPDRLMEPFYSRRRGGTGLGLWIVQRILSEHGGCLALRDRDGGGLVAEVRLPCRRVR